MSTDVNKKRKDKRKRKAMLEALQQQEYLEERTRIGLNNDDDDEFILRPAEDEYELLSEPPVEHSGSGIGAKITFALLFGVLAVIVGVVFFELGGDKSDVSQKFEPILQEPVVESVFEEYVVPKPVYEQSTTTPTEFEDTSKDDVTEEKIPFEQDIRHGSEFSEGNDAVKEAVEEVPYERENVEELTVQKTPEDNIMATDEAVTSTEEAVPIDIPQENIEVITDEIQKSSSSGETADQYLTEDDSAQADVKEPQQTSAAEVVANNLSEQYIVETVGVSQSEQLKPILDEIADKDLSQEGDTKDNVIDIKPVLSTEKTVESQDIKEAFEAEIGNSELKGDLSTETPIVQNQATGINSSQFENAEIKEEKESSAPPDESFTMRAEREAVQDAVDQVWVMTVRCLEELRALQNLARSSSTHNMVDEIRIRLEPLRQQLDNLVRDTQNNVFDGALEQAAHLERSLAAVLNELEEARVADAAFKEEAPVEQTSIPDAREAAAREEPKSEVDRTETFTEQDEVIPEPNESKFVELLQSEDEKPDLEEESNDDDDDDDGDVYSEDVEAPEEESVLDDGELEYDTVNGDLKEEAETKEEILEPTHNNLPIQDKQEMVEDIVNDIHEEVLAIADEDKKPEVGSKGLDNENESDDVKVPPKESQLIDELNEINSLVDESPSQALLQFERILERNPTNATALYGRARSLDSLAEKERSNTRLEQAIFAYRAVLDLEKDVDDYLYRKAAEKCIEKMRFRGFNGKAIRIQQRLISRFSDDIDLQNQLAVGFLIAGQPSAAKDVLETILQKWPDSGFAKVHYGFVLKTSFNDNEQGAKYMSEGIATKENGVVDGRFYFHLGDALSRLGRQEEAQQVYIDGEKEGLFLSRDQRSLYNVDRLTGRPWWTKEETTYSSFFDLLENRWQDIRDEGVSLLTLSSPEGFTDESENLRDTGVWKQFELFVRGKKVVQHCTKAPITCSLIENFKPASQCKRGQVKFSIMHPGTHVWPHTGPTNCRIRAHLGLVVPEGVHLRVANKTDTWKEGKIIIFDDSFEHEVWHNGTSYRLVLIVDVWHPELTDLERQTMSPI